MNSKVSRLSVVMPNYNHSQYLVESVSAIASQSRAPDEVIVVDDASTDGSIAVLQRLVEKYPMVRIIENKRNLGVLGAWNVGLDAASGEYIYNAAADDKVLPGFFESAMNALARYPQAGLCSGPIGIIHSDSNKLSYSGRPFSLDGYFRPSALLPLVRQGLGFSGLSSLAKRTSIDSTGGFPPELGLYSDWFTMQVVAFREGVCMLPRMVAAHRILHDSFSHATRLSEQKDLLQRVLTLLDSSEYQDVAPYFRQGSLQTAGWPLAWMIFRKPINWKWISLSYCKLLSMRAVEFLAPEFLLEIYRKRRAERTKDQ